MSHEIRTPLHAILSMGRMVLDSRQARGSPSTQEVEDLTQIIKSSEALQNLVNDILFISKIQTNTFELSMSTFDVCELTEDVISSHFVQASAKQLEIVSLIRLPEFSLEVCYCVYLCCMYVFMYVCMYARDSCSYCYWFLLLP